MKPLLLSLITLAAILAGCATPNPPSQPSSSAAVLAVPTAVTPAKDSVLRSVAIDRALEDRILALDPEHVSETDVATTLSKAPAPHIMLIHGGIYPVHLMMESTGKFLVKMGYPEDRIRDPGDQRWSYSPYEDSTQLAGLVAWYYEHEGVRPMMIGHSQGGIQAVKVLYELAGDFGNSIRVFDPYTNAALDRTTIVDPLSGSARPVVGLQLSYMSTIGAGGMTLLLPNQWSMIGRMYTIPDTVEEYTGYVLVVDPIGWRGTYTSNGKAAVHNFGLPTTYNHLTTPYVSPLADEKGTREWIAAYVPGKEPAAEAPGEKDGYATTWAADVWYYVKKHWTLEAQRLVRAKRAATGITLTDRLK